ncbi:hypothetical protein ACF1BP_16220 [Streptomyces sp. NPDC014735]|uniref:hypothetical protein n=1 Tax=unclassified Streptomyces TaxID=2593676 RepID=UPI0036FC2DF6
MADDTRPGTTDRAGAEFGAAAGARNPKGAADPECSAAWSGERGHAHEAVTGAPTVGEERRAAVVHRSTAHLLPDTGAGSPVRRSPRRTAYRRRRRRDRPGMGSANAPSDRRADALPVPGAPPAPVDDGVPLVGFGDEPALLVARPAGRRPMPERRGPDRVLPIVAPS